MDYSEPLLLFAVVDAFQAKIPMTLATILFQLQEGSNHAIDEFEYFLEWEELLGSHPGLEEGFEGWAERIAEEDWLGAAELGINEWGVLHSLEVLRLEHVFTLGGDRGGCELGYFLAHLLYKMIGIINHH